MVSDLILIGVTAMMHNLKVHCGCCKWLLAAILLSLLTAGITYFVVPVQYEAIARIQILVDKPKLIFDERTNIGYNEFVQTQFAMMRNPTVLEKALKNVDVAKLPCVVNPKDKVGWLQKKLHIKTEGQSEFITVSMKCYQPDASEKIVNAIVDAYFEYRNLTIDGNNQDLTQRLNAELRRQTANARSLQDAIREKLEKAAEQVGTVIGLGMTESLQRDVYMAENQLVGLRANRKMLQEVLEHPEKIPPLVLLQAVKNDTQFQALNTQLDTLKQHREQLKPLLTTSDDPRMKLLEQSIADTEKKLKPSTENAGLWDIIRADIERQSWELNKQIRTQELLVQELSKKYTECLLNSKKTLPSMLDVQRDQNQLERINKVLDVLSDRLVTLQSERYAPDQVQLLRRATVPEVPDTSKQMEWTISAAAAVFFFILLLGIAVNHCRNCH